MKILHTSFLLFVFSLLIGQQANDANKLLEKVNSKLNTVKDYQAQIQIHIDIDFIDIPDKTAKIFFKHPDKIKYQSNDFLLLPKKGFEFSLNELTKYKYSAIYINKEIIDSNNYEVIKIIPHEQESEIILATLWINPSEDNIYKMDVNTKQAGNFTINFVYNTSNILPEQVKISFNLKEFELPTKFMNNGKEDILKQKSIDGESRAEITIIYSNYVINSGLPDSLFKE